MEDLSLHLLDIAENSVNAGASRVKITVIEDAAADLLLLEVEDNGRGMSEEECTRALDPFYSTRQTRRIGLGLPFLQEACRASGGDLTLTSAPQKGTKVRASFRLSHIDLKPMGDLALTLVTLIAGHPEIEWVYYHRRDDAEFEFNSRQFQESYPEIVINHPEVLNAIRNYIDCSLSFLRREHGRSQSL